MRFRKIYLEISNVCNLRCSFCPGTSRAPRTMSEDELSILLPKLRPYTDFLYFHLMGEPLCHPKLKEFLQIAHSFGFRVIITTNGTMLKSKKTIDILLNADALHKINISLHAFEANDLTIPFDEYINECISFGKEVCGKKIVVYRLWNEGGKNELNEDILSKLQTAFGNEWKEERHGIRISDKTYLEYGDKFDWPDLAASDKGDEVFCYGLRDQLGVLCDGTVVPCCLDRNGDIALGNLFHNNMEEILDSKRAKSIYNGFSSRCATEELCRKCSYARRFK